MTYEEVRQQIKNTHLNRISKLYTKPYQGDQYDSAPYSEQRDFEVYCAIDTMHKELNKAKIQFKETNES